MKRTTQLLKFLMLLAILTIPGCIISGTFMLLMPPCTSANFGYFLLSPCVNPELPWKVFPDCVLRIFVICFAIRVYLHIVSCFLLETVYFSSLHCFCLANYQRLFWRNFSVEFWNFARTIKMFKEIQLLTTVYNLIHGSILSVAVTFFVTCNFIVATYALVGLYSEISLPEFIFFGFMVFDCFLCMLICDGGYKATVNNVAKDILAKVHATVAPTNKPVMRLYLRSWPTAKIKLGNTNFYDKETPLNLIEFSIAQVVSLLLL